MNIVPYRFQLFIIILITGLSAENPFLESLPYAAPEFQQYDIRHHTDHNHPTQTTNGVNARFDGEIFYNNIVAFNCPPGVSCYDGHAGNDYHMPLNTPILAAADGYVVWSAFSPGADPCPGGISPNGDTGIIILYHYNDYFTCYLHLNPPLNVAVGETVAAGDTIGFNGMTGCASSPHLHFEVRKENYFFDQQLPWVVDPYGWWGDYEDPIISLRGFENKWLWKSTSLIDDGDVGFQRFYGPNWSYKNTGYNDDSWTAPVSNNQENSTHYAIWVPELADSGEFNIDVFLPNLSELATAAQYEIITKDSSGINTKSVITVDQTSNPGGFITIASLSLRAGSNCAIILRDAVGSESNGSYVAFDAIRFVNNQQVGVQNETSSLVVPRQIVVHPSFPNPFNASTNIRYEVMQNSLIEVSIYNISGKHVDTISKGFNSPGKYVVLWDGTNKNNQVLPSGVYYCVVETNGFRDAQKIVLLK
ncbi:MAG: Murein DD-endopeptidase MepM [Chloroflexota bacterium]|nr:MAG: Murein DD-endopeptidase MepM [Chloroflexota bacterium]